MRQAAFLARAGRDASLGVPVMRKRPTSAANRPLIAERLSTDAFASSIKAAFCCVI